MGVGNLTPLVAFENPSLNLWKGKGDQVHNFSNYFTPDLNFIQSLAQQIPIVFTGMMPDIAQ